MATSTLAWGGFFVFVLAMLILDLKLFKSGDEKSSFKKAVIWSCVWVGVALLFNLGVYFWKGSEKALEFLAGYLIEKSLSVDNIFVFILLFEYFCIPTRYQHRVLFLGILGALIMRLVFIVVGIQLLAMFHWLIYIFGAFLVLTGIKMCLKKEGEANPGKNVFVKLAKKIFPVSDELDGEKFFVRKSTGLFATPLFLALIAIESSDVIFAVDSVPAVLAVSQDAFIVYTSNVFAILGLRAIYLVLANVINKFCYLKLGVSAILVFIGAKMIISSFYKIPVGWALVVIFGILTASIVASLLKSKKAQNCARCP